MGCACRIAPLRIFIQGLSQVHKIETSTPSSFLRLHAPGTASTLGRNQLLVARQSRFLHASRRLNQNASASVVSSPPATAEPEHTLNLKSEASLATEIHTEVAEPAEAIHGVKAPESANAIEHERAVERTPSEPPTITEPATATVSTTITESVTVTDTIVAAKPVETAELVSTPAPVVTVEPMTATQHPELSNILENKASEASQVTGAHQLAEVIESPNPTPKNFKVNAKFKDNDRFKGNDRFKRNDRYKGNDRFQGNDWFQGNGRFNDRHKGDGKFRSENKFGVENKFGSDTRFGGGDKFKDRSWKPNTYSDNKTYDKPWTRRTDDTGESGPPRDFSRTSSSSEPIVGPSPSEPNPDIPIWKIQKEALKEKFPDGWKPRKRLSPDALAGIRALNAQFPETYTTSTLASRFEVSPENIRRILKGNWAPSADEDKERQDRWFRRGMKVWDHQAALGMKPPRKWRLEGIKRDPSYYEKRQGAIRHNRDLEEEDDRVVRANMRRPATRRPAQRPAQRRTPRP